MFLRKSKVGVDMESIEFELDDFKDRKFWDKIFKDLHTSLPSNFGSSFESFDIDSNALELYKTLLLDEGYVQAPKLPWENWFHNAGVGGSSPPITTIYLKGFSDASSYLNGAIVPVEGGQTAW